LLSYLTQILRVDVDAVGAVTHTEDGPIEQVEGFAAQVETETFCD
jgi:hypothetical protein